MKRDLRLWMWLGMTFTSVSGTLFHFLYEWIGKSPFAAPFSAINESTWEHMKLLYLPLFIVAIIQKQFFKGTDNFWCIKLIGLTAGLLFIPIVFYTYNGAIGASPDWLNITIFFVATGLVFLLETALFKKNTFSCFPPHFALFMFYFIGLLFMVFSFFLQNSPYFKTR